MSRKKKFQVEVCRTGFAFATIEVMATSQEKANEIALDEAGDHEYSEKNSEYSLTSQSTSDGLVLVRYGTSQVSWISAYKNEKVARKHITENAEVHFGKITKDQKAEINSAIKNHDGIIEFDDWSAEIEWGASLD